MPIVADLTSVKATQASKEDADFFDRTFVSVVLSAEDLGRFDRIMSSDGFHALSNTLFLARGRKPAA